MFVQTVRHLQEGEGCSGMRRRCKQLGGFTPWALPPRSGGPSAAESGHVTGEAQAVNGTRLLVSGPWK